MKKARRFMSTLLSTALVTSMLPVSVSRAEDVTAGDSGRQERQVQANEVEDAGLSRLGENAASASQNLVEPKYTEEETVTLIVEMEEAPVMDYYGTSALSLEDGEESAGEAVSEFLSSEEAKQISDMLAEGQDQVIAQIQDLTGGGIATFSFENSASEDTIEITARWTNLANAIAVKAPYGYLEAIKAIDGVKNAYVEHTYDYPTPVSSVVEEGKGKYSYSLDMVDLGPVWAEGYTGKGMVVAVLDTGLDIKMVVGNGQKTISSVHEAFSPDSFKSDVTEDDLRWTDEKIADFLEDNSLVSNTANDGSKIEWDQNALYKNIKVPYACDYADGDLHVYPTSSHGTHVAGTIAGYAEDEEGAVKFSGVAPDAQILAMKVFPDETGGATESSIYNALNDSMMLGADIINLSLGSDNGFAEDDTLQNEMYERVRQSGIVMMTSAGNSDNSVDNNNYNGNALSSNPDTSMMSSPAVYDTNLAVASIDNTINVESYLFWSVDGGEAQTASFSDPFSVAMKSDFSGKDTEVILVGGTGTYDDYAKAGFNNGYNGGKDGIALVKRGEISFADKINNAMYFSGVNSRGERYGVKAVIIYDNDPEGTTLINMSADNTSLDSAFITGKDGAAMEAALKAGKRVTIRVSEEDQTIDNPTAGQMSVFSSWGAGPSLELKPEITAPGGNIWSSVPDSANAGKPGYVGNYEMMSGTSMAAPHMSGIGLLVRQRVQAEAAFQGISREQEADLVSQLVVSTAIPQKDETGVYYSPRLQGAGLVNAGAAVDTPAYITVDGQTIGKLELSDDPEKKGTYDIDYKLHNISENAVKYNVQVVLMRPEVTTTQTQWGDRQVLTTSDVVLASYDLGQVAAKAGETTAFHQTVSLDANAKALLDGQYENGSFVEGFVILTDASGDKNPQLGLPLLAFYGDWTAAPIFDSANWLESSPGGDYLDLETSWNPNLVGSMLIANGSVIGYYNLGQNVFDPTSIDEQLTFHAENVTISPDNNGYFDKIDDFILYQLRDARLVAVKVTDANTGEVYMQDGVSYLPRTSYDTTYAAPVPYSSYGLVPSWDGTDLDGNVLPSGTQCIMTITAYGDGDYPLVYDEEAGRVVTDFDAVISAEAVPTFNGHAMDMTGDVLSFPVVVDTVAPKLVNNAVSIYEENGRTYLKTSVYDEDGSIASVEVTPQVKRSYKEGYGDPSYEEVGTDRNNPFLSKLVYDAGCKTLDIVADITEYAHTNESYQGENNYYNFEWTGNIILSCGDYGANDRSYAIKADATEGIVLSQTSAFLHPGDTFELSVNDNTKEEKDTLTRTSSNPEVATVDEYGKVTAIAEGQALITVSNGTSSAVCVVAVEEHSTQIESFDLSIEDFSFLKPEGQLTVKVVNLQPADAVIDSASWSVVEDDDYAENYAAGLLSVSQGSADRLTGNVYMTVTGAEELIPGGHGTLTVTLDGVSRTMDINWNDLYQSREQDDLISGMNFDEQAIYVEQGETATLLARYRQKNQHSVNDVLADVTNLTIEGPDFFYVGGQYQAVLKAAAGYQLPESVSLYTVYDYGYEAPIYNYEGYRPYEYDPATGLLTVRYCPSGASNKLKIVANAVADTTTESVSGNDAGIAAVSDGDAGAGSVFTGDYPRPDALYGPFDWTVLNGSGTLDKTTVSNWDGEYEAAAFTPDKPGVSIVQATTKDGQYSVNFAVISEGVKADEILLDTHNVELKEGESYQLNASLNPEPTLEEDTKLIYKSFAPEVAEISEDGTITAKQEGYAYIRVYTATDYTIQSYCKVYVTPAERFTVTFKDYDGTVLKTETVKSGEAATAPEVPGREGYTFSGWDKSFDAVTENLTVTAQYTKDETPVPDPKPTPDPTPAPKPTPEPTPVPNPTTPSDSNSQNTGSTVTEDITSQTQVRIPVVYVVKKGDTLLRIAAKNKLTLAQLLELNPQIKNPNRIYPGQEIMIGEKAGDGTLVTRKDVYGREYYTVRRGDNLSRIAARHHLSLHELFLMNKEAFAAKYIYAGQKIRIK